MKIKFFTPIIIGFVLILSCQQEEVLVNEPTTIYDKAPGLTLDESQIISLQVFSPSLEGNLLGDPALRNVNVYIPAGYNNHPDNKYPVIYYLPGQPTGSDGLFNPAEFEVLKMIAGLQQSVDFPENGFKCWMDDLMENEIMNKFILVIPDATNKYGFSFYSKSEVNGDYEAFIAKDLVKWIDKEFNTIKNRNGRALVGHCMGGYGAMKLAMKYPQVFGQAAGMSPSHFPIPTVEYCANFIPVETAMWGFEGPTLPYDVSNPYKFITNTMYGASAAWLPNPNNPPYFIDLPFSYTPEGTAIIDEELMTIWNSNNLFGLIPQYLENLKELNHLYFDCGINDELGETLPNISMHEMLDQLDVEHEFDLFDGFHISHVYDRLQKNFIKLSEGFPQKSKNYSPE